MDIGNWIESTRLANADTFSESPGQRLRSQHRRRRASRKSASPQSQQDPRPSVEPIQDEEDLSRTHNVTGFSLSENIRKQAGLPALHHPAPSNRHSDDEDGQVHEPYTRRSRRKTRIDLYEPRRSSKKKKSRKRARSANQDGSRSKKRRRHTSDVLKTFHADNVKQERLTLKAEPGIFSRGRASMPRRAQGVPDLTFSEMKFLQRPRNVQMNSAPAAEDTQSILEEADQHSTQSPSEPQARTPPVRLPLQDRHVNLQPTVRRTAIGKAAPVDVNHQVSIAMLPPRISSTRIRSSRHPSQSTGPSYFTWSASPSAVAGRSVEQVKTVADLPTRPPVSDDHIVTHAPGGGADFPSSFVPRPTELTSTSFTRRSEVSMSQKSLSDDMHNRPDLRTSYGPSGPRTWPALHRRDSSARAESMLGRHQGYPTRERVHRESRQMPTQDRDLSLLNQDGEVLNAPDRKQQQLLQDPMTEVPYRDQPLHDRQQNVPFWIRHQAAAISDRQTVIRPTMYPELISDDTLASPRQSSRNLEQQTDERFVPHGSSEDRNTEQIGHTNMVVYPSDGDATAFVMPSSYRAERDDRHVYTSERRQPPEDDRPKSNDHVSEWDIGGREASIEADRWRQTIHQPREPAMQDFWLPNRLY